MKKKVKRQFAWFPVWKSNGEVVATQGAYRRRDVNLLNRHFVFVEKFELVPVKRKRE